MLTLATIAAAVLVALLVLLLMGWGGRFRLAQRVGLAAAGAGLLWAAVPRFQGAPPGAGDVLMLAGWATYLAATYGPAIWRKADSLDGHIDGRIGARRAEH